MPEVSSRPYSDHFRMLTIADEVLNSGNQVQCDQMFLDGLLLELGVIKSTIILNPAAFGLGISEEEVLERDAEPVMEDATDKLAKVNAELDRLKSHPELFRNEYTREKFFKQADDACEVLEDILDGDMTISAHMQRMAKKFATIMPTMSDPADPAALGEPWETWCRERTSTMSEPPKFKEFRAQHPEMILMGTQMVPHMGVLIAEHWRKQVEAMVLTIAQV